MIQPYQIYHHEHVMTKANEENIEQEEPNHLADGQKGLDFNSDDNL